MTSGSFASPNTIMVQLQNNTLTTLNTFSVNFSIKRYRINTAVASVTFFYSTDGSTWTAASAGDVAASALPTGANAYDFSLSGSTFTSVVNRSFTLSTSNITPNAAFYLRWTFNTVGANSQGLGLDNFSIVPAPIITAQPIGQSVASGSTASVFTVTATGTGVLSYQWRKGGQSIAGANSNTLSLGAVTSTNADNYDVIVTDSVGSTTSDAVGLTITPVAQTITFGMLSNLTLGAGPFIVSATASSGLAPTFSILSGPATATGTNGSTITVTGAGTVVIRAAQAGSADFNAAPNVDQSFMVAQATQTISFGSLTNHTYGDAPFTVSAVASSGLSPTFTIFSGPATATGTNGSTITINGAGTVVVRAAQVGNANYLAAANVDQSFTVAKADQTISFTGPADKLASDAPFTVSATATSGLAVAFSIFSGGSIAAASGTNGSTITLAGAPNFGAVTIRATQAGDANYNAAPHVDRTFQVTSGVVAPAITADPVAQAVLTGTNVSFTVTASGTGPLTYQWKRGAAHVGTNSATLTLNNVTAADAGSYTVAVTNSAGSATSQAATLTVSMGTQTITFAALADKTARDPAFALAATASSGLAVAFTIVSGPANLSGNTLTLTGSAGVVTVRASQAGNVSYLAAPEVERAFTVTLAPGAPVFTSQPSSVTVDPGAAATLAAVVSAFPAASYQWRKDGAALPGATSPTLTIAQASGSDAGSYVLVATNSLGSATSTAATLSLVKSAQTIAFETNNDPRPIGSTITLTAVASSGLPVQYALVSGAASLSGSRLIGNGATVVVRASQPGNASIGAATPVERTFTFTPVGVAPFLTSAPYDQTVAAGTAVTFFASALGTPAPTYQWQKNGAPIAGATKSALTIASATLDDAANYTVVARNASGSASASARLTVNAAPAIGTSPTDRAVYAGDAVSFTVAATGFPAPTFQWRRNGSALAGATSATLTLPAVRTADAGRYDVVVTNPLGSATSTAATLTVNVHDFSGDYFGRFAGAEGSFVLHVRTDGTAVFLGFLPGSRTGFATIDVRVDSSGGFALPFTALTADVGRQAAEGGRLTADGGPTEAKTESALSAIGPPPSAVGASSPLDTTPAVEPPSIAPLAVTLRGAINDAAGTLSATLAEMALSLNGTRTARIGGATAQAGFYQASLVGSATGRSYVVVAPDGQAFALTSGNGAVDGASGMLTSAGRLTVTTAAQAALDLGFTGGALSGTVRDAGGVTTTLAGAVEGLAGTEHLVNLSVRSLTGPNAATLVTGFYVTGATKQLLIRASGPALTLPPLNVTGVLPDPALQVLRDGRVVAQNDDWNTPVANGTAVSAAVARVGAFPFRPGSADAALVAQLAPGAYTMQVLGDATGPNASGVVLAEIYEVLDASEPAGARRLVNLSARGIARPGDPLIAGFAIGGTAPQRVLIRGVGPTLALPPINLAGTLANPQLTLFRGATAIKSNDDWFRDPNAPLIRDTATKVGAFALGATSLDAALLLYLEPGVYTAQVTGPSNTTGPAGTGAALVEVYEVQP